jgi:hypothetical protein
MIIEFFEDIRETGSIVLKEEEYTKAITMGVQLALPSAGTRDRWWFEMDGQRRRFYDCDAEG